MQMLIGTDVRARTRQQLVVCARAMVVTILFDEGFTETTTGEIFGITHASTHHYKNKMREILTAPGYDHERNLWEQFKKEI